MPPDYVSCCRSRLEKDELERLVRDEQRWEAEAAARTRYLPVALGARRSVTSLAQNLRGSVVVTRLCCSSVQRMPLGSACVSQA